MDRDEFYRALLMFDGEYVGFNSFVEIIKEMEQSLQLYRQTSIVKNLVVIGESGCGKTSLARAFCNRYPRQHLLEQTITPVAYIEVPSIGTVGALARQILASLGDPFPEKGRVIDQTARIEVMVRNAKTEMLILDEAQHIYDRGQQKSQYATSDWLKSLVNSIQIPMVLFGIPRLENLLHVNVQLRRRFRAPLTLSLGDPEDPDFLELNLDVINALLPILPLPLASREMNDKELARRIYYATDGRVGYLKELLAQALEKAWEAGGDCVTRRDLESAFMTIWSASKGALNPFNSEFIFRRLDRSGEPFAMDRNA